MVMNNNQKINNQKNTSTMKKSIIKKNKFPKVDLVLNDLNNSEIASPFKRALAFLTDLFIIQILLLPFSFYIEQNVQLSNDFFQNINLMQSNPDIMANLSLIVFVIFFFVFFYFTYFEYKLGQTPGKLLFGIKVVNYNEKYKDNYFNILKKESKESFISPLDKKKNQDRSENITFFQSMLRNLFLVPIFPFYFLWIIDPVYMILTKKRLSDNFSKTIVINNKITIQKDTVFPVLKLIGIFFLLIFLISSFLPFFSTNTSQGKNVAVIPIHGVLSVSEGDMFSSDVSSSESIINKLEKANKNSGIVAIILDINSPGGSPVATDEISQKIKSINKTKIALIREYGASGSYWVATSTDYIFANRMSLVGSIGVIGSYLDFSGLLERYNITYQRYVSGNLKDMGSPFKAASEEEKIVFQKLIDDLNNIFIEEVAQNRKMEIEKVKKLATGQVFLGIEAKNLGLIDEIGTKDDVIKYIEKKHNITANIIEYKDSKNIFDCFLSSKFTNKIGNYLNYRSIILN